MKNRVLSSVVAAFFFAPLLHAGPYRATNQETSPEPVEASANYDTNEGPFLTIKSKNDQRKFSRSELLKSPYLKKLIVEKDPAYKDKKSTYSVIPASQLFGGFKVNDSTGISFKCLDGFSAPISTEQLLNTNPNGAIAYIAIELPNDSWPLIKNHGNHSAGPFYLVWENPEKSQISIEQWPFQLTGFDIKGTIAEQFPHTGPDSGIQTSNPVAKGYRSFLKNCFACHTMNGEGLAHVGPDLNIPFSPTEYFKPPFLEMLIRNPKDMRQWPESKMSHFDRSAIPDAELKDLISYLQYMSKHKVSFK